VLRLAAIVLTVVNVGVGLLMGVTRGGAFNLFGVPGPLPFYGDFLALFLVASGLGFVPAIRRPDTYRFYIWVMGVGVKLIVASMLLRVWFIGLTGGMLLVAALGEAAIGAFALWALLQAPGVSRGA
jgi:hypothetical protein